MFKINNEYGVSLSSWKKENNEIVYQKNGSWTKSDPFLFPNIGNAYKSILINDELITHPRHGMFTSLNSQFTKSENIYSYNSTKNSYYPFDFKIEKTYFEEDNTLNIQSKVTNNEDFEIKYQLGYHLAFIIDLNSKLQFNDDFYQINDMTKDGVVLESTTCFKPLNKSWTIDLDYIQERDSLIFNNKQIREIKLVNSNYELKITLGDNMNCLTLWSNSNKEDVNQFLCIEPWSNLVTTKEKENIQNLSSGETKIYDYKIEYIPK